MIDSVWQFVTGFGEAWYPFLLGTVAMIETLFPPFPGDVVYVALSGLGIGEGVSRFLLWTPGFIGCFISTYLLDAMGRSSKLEKLEMVIIGSSRRNGMERAKRILEKHGSWIIAASRFIPGIRSLIVIAAAASGMKRSSVLMYAGISAALWYLLLIIAGGFAGAGIASAEEFMGNLTMWLWVAVAAALILGALFLLLRLKGTER